MSPLFQYNCPKCRAQQEELFSLKDRPETVKCKNCGKRAKYGLSPTQFTVNGANAANRYSGDSNYKWFGAGEKK